MNAKEFFVEVVTRNYLEAQADHASFRKLWNAVVSMNTVAEYLALDQLSYGSLVRSDIDRAAAAIRKDIPELEEIKRCAETLKHVRRHIGQALIGTSTGVDLTDPSTWHLDHGGTLYDLRVSLTKAYEAVKRHPNLA